MSDVPVCPRHPDRESWVRCQRCNRPACPECQRPAAVGVQCVDCVAQGNRDVRTARTSFGGVLRSGDTVVTKVVIALCLVIYVAKYVLPAGLFDYLPLGNFSQQYSNAFSADTWWQPLTSGFLHAGLLHLLFNMYALWVTGQYLEPLLGRLRFSALYFVSLLAGAAGGLLLPGTADSSLVGASGGIFGLFAAMFVVNRHLGRQTGQIAALIVINFVIGVVYAGISWQAHLGGLLAGAVVAWVMARGRRGNPVLQWGGTAAVAVVVVGLLAYAATGSRF